MQHLWSLDEASLQGAWLTIGSFDGVHRGHQEIVRKLTAGARASASPAVALTFYPHPALVLRGQRGPFYLTTTEERAALLGKLGVDVVITHPFSRQLAAMSARDFVNLLKARLDFRQLWVGGDFALGRGREGDIPTLSRLGQELAFSVQVIPPVEIEGQVVSSSQVRTLIASGDVHSASRWLGRPYRVAGEIVHGDGRGRTIGIPTANLATWPEQLLPAAGVYAGLARLGRKTWGAAVNLGVRPTFDGRTVLPQLEAHLLDFDGNLYAKTLQLDFIARLRGEQRFPNIQALVDQIQQDITQTRRILAEETVVRPR
jgi:riboflavin kinase/FMN adenylyltransferase